MKYAFLRRQVVETPVWFTAATEAEAWAKALDGDRADEAGDHMAGRLPVFRRTPKLDEPEFDL